MPETTHDGADEKTLIAGPPAYDREKLYERLAEVQGYLAELRYIDTALQYIEEQDEVEITDLSFM